MQNLRYQYFLGVLYQLLVAQLTGGFFGFFFYVPYSTLLHLPPFRFHCVGGCCCTNSWKQIYSSFSSRRHKFFSSDLSASFSTNLWYLANNFLMHAYMLSYSRCSSAITRIVFENTKITVYIYIFVYLHKTCILYILLARSTIQVLENLSE